MSTIFKRLKRFNPKKILVVSAFLVAMAGAAGLGLATKQFGSAAGVRDTGTNPILNKGSIGCLTVGECVSDFKANNPSDVQAIYADRGLSESEYDRFKSTAVPGKVYKDGRMVVNDPNLGTIEVGTAAWSMGRNTWGGQRDPMTINGKTYYKSPTTSSFVSDSIDAFFMFNDAGTVEFAVLTACGNPVWGKNKTPEYGCKSLNKSAVSDKKDTYDFTTTLNPTKLAKLDKLVYDFGDGSGTVTKSNASDKVQHTFKPGTWTTTVTVYYKLPGGKVVSVKCKTTVTVKEAPKPFYECKALTPGVLNDEKTKFRFTVKTNQGNGATLKNVDFTVDGSTVTGVTDKDQDGNIFRDYEFEADGQERTVTTRVNFLVDGQTVAAPANPKCTAKVTPEKTPECKPGIPVGSPECEEEEEECKPGVPVGSPECEEVEECKPGVPVGHRDCEETPPAELPNTGMGSVLGIFAGTSILGAIGHRLYVSLRRQ